MPSIRAPSETRKRQRSWTCGSQAAFEIVVRPGASVAAMTAFSVAITDASSRKMCVPRSRPCASRSGRRPRPRRRARASAWMCGSSRRRPITSPPGGGTLARPRRASSGPASRNDARMRLASSSSSSFVASSAAWTRTSFAPDPLDVGAERAGAARASSPTSRIRGTFESSDRLVGEQARGEDRQRAVLVPGRADAPGERLAALDHERLATAACSDGGGGHGGGYPSARLGADPRAGLGDADPLHEERGAAPPRARGRGVDGVRTRASSARTRSCGA